MRYFVTFVSIVLGAAVVWVVFFSGIILNKKAIQQEKEEAKPSVGEVETNMVSLETIFGEIIIELDEEAAPQTSANFKKLASDGFYNNLTFHRVIPGFVIQGGDPKGDGTGGPGYTVPAEIKLKHKRGAVAMARLPDAVNPTKASSGSQFYIVLSDLPSLDGEYTVFGQVTEGMDVVDKIAAVKTGFGDKPVESVIIIKASIKRLE